MERKIDINGGFTLIEVLIVMIILGLLASLVGPRLVGNIGKSKTKTARAQIELLSTALESYHLDVGQYPTTEQGLSALLKAPEGIEGWDGPYLKNGRLPNDPWNVPYFYRCPSEHEGVDFDILTYGADKKEGGEKDDGDVSNSK